MKKFYSMLIISLVSIAMSLSSCSSCGGGNNETIDDNDTTKVDSAKTEKVASLNVEHLIATDRQEVYNLIKGKDYRWFETSIDLVNYLDSEEASAEIEGLTNTFQWVDQATETSYDVHVIMSTWNNKGEHSILMPPGFCVGNHDMSEEAIKITFEEAFARLMESNSNSVRPHSRKCVLRQEVGTKDANPQYIFGNTKHQVYVDATTGEVTEINPAFNKPLGEWP